MKKLTKTAKYILFASIAVLCVCAIVLGCVFGLKKPAPDNGGTNPPTPTPTPTPPPVIKQEKFTAAQKLLADEIISGSEEIVYEILDVVPYADRWEYSDITMLGTNYYAVNVSGTDIFFIYKTTEGGSIEVKDITDPLHGGKDGASSVKIEAIVDGYVFISYDLGTSTYYSLMSFANYDEPTEIFNFTVASDIEVPIGGIVLKENYFVFTTLDGLDLDFYYGKLQESKLTNDEIGHIEGVQFSSDKEQFKLEHFDNAFFIRSGLSSKVVYLKEDTFAVLEKTNTTRQIASETKVESYWGASELTSTKILLTKTINVLDSTQINDNSVRSESKYMNYEYYVFDYSDETNSETAVPEIAGYPIVKANTNNEKLTTSYSLVYQKTSENKYAIKTYITAYFNETRELVVQFESNASEYITYAGTNTFVTNYRILKANETTLPTTVLTFADDVESGIVLAKDASSINSEYFVVKTMVNKLEYYGVMNAAGSLVIDPANRDYVNIYEIFDGKCHAYDALNNYYVVDLATGNSSEIENYVYDSVRDSHGTGIYFEKIDINKYALKKDAETTLEEIVFKIVGPETTLQTLRGSYYYEIYTVNDLMPSKLVVYKKANRDETNTFVSSFSAISGEMANATAVPYASSDSFYFVNSSGTKMAEASMAGGTVIEKGKTYYVDPIITIEGDNSYRLTNATIPVSLGLVSTDFTITGTTFPSPSDRDATYTVSYTISNSNLSWVIKPTVYLDTARGKVIYKATFDYHSTIAPGFDAEEGDEIAATGSILYYHVYFCYEAESTIYSESINNENVNFLSNGSAIKIAELSLEMTIPTHDIIGAKVGYYRTFQEIEGGTDYSNSYYAPYNLNDYNQIDGLDLTLQRFGADVGSTFTFNLHEQLNIFLYAFYIENTYTLKIDADGDDVFEETKTVKAITETVAVRHVDRVGYTPSSWSIRNVESGANYQWHYGSAFTNSSTNPVFAINKAPDNSSGTTDPVWKYYFYLNRLRTTSGEVTLKANYSTNWYIVTLDNQGATTTGTTEIVLSYGVAYAIDGDWQNYNLNDVPIDLPTKTGSTFEGYYYGNVLNGVQYIDKNGYITQDADLYHTEDFTLYAKWTINTYTINYETTYGVYDTITAAFGDWVFVPQPTREFYTFKNWTITGLTATCVHYFRTSSNSGAMSHRLGTIEITSSCPYFLNLRDTSGVVSFTANWTANDYTINFSADAKPLTHVYVNDELIAAMDWTDSWNETDVKLGIFAMGQFDNQWFSTSGVSGRFYGCKIWKEGVLVRDFYPVFRFSDRVLGLYDLVNKQFYENAGDETFVYGSGVSYDASSYGQFSVDILHEYQPVIYFTTTGTQYFDTGLVVNPTDNYVMELDVAWTNSDIAWTGANGYLQVKVSSSKIEATTNTDSSLTGVKEISGRIKLRVDYTNYVYYDTLSYGAEDSASVSASKHGYELSGWDVAGMESGFNHVIGSTITTGATAKIETFNSITILNLRGNQGAVHFTARWTANTYNIVYDLAGGAWEGTEEHPSSVKYDEVFKVEKPLIAKKGYTFESWIVTNMSKGQLKFYGMSANSLSSSHDYDDYEALSFPYWHSVYFKNFRNDTGTVTFTANWTANVYNIEYEAGGDHVTFDEDMPTTATFDAWSDNIYNPTRLGYTFAGWIVSGLDDSVEHYVDFCDDYEQGIGGLVDFYSYQGYYRSSTDPNVDLKLNAMELHCIYNFHSEAGATVTLTATWQPIVYELIYLVSSYVNDISTKPAMNVLIDPSHLEESIEYSQDVQFDEHFTTMRVATDSSQSNAVGLPAGCMQRGWYAIPAYRLGALRITINEAATNNPSQVLELNTEYLYSYDFLYNMFGEQEMMDEGDERYGLCHGLYLYPIYTYAPITLKYYLPKYDFEPNNINNYKAGKVVTGLKYGINYQFLPYDDEGVLYYMVSPNFYTDGDLSYSITDFVYNGTTYYTTAAQTVPWGISNTYAKNPNAPVFYLYGVNRLQDFVFTYHSDIDGYSVRAKSTTISGDVKVPIKYNDGVNGLKSVLVIEENGFKDCVNMTSFTALSVTTVGKSAFEGCKGFDDSVTLTAVTTLGARAFVNCQKLLECNLGTVGVIPDAAFANCTLLESVSVSGVHTVGNNAFQYTSLDSFSMTGANCVIGNNAFYASYLSSFSLDGSFDSIGNYAFYNTTSLTSFPFKFNDGATVGYSAFAYSGLTSATIQGGLQSIPSGMFSNCSKLTSIDLSACTMLENIGNSAFNNTKITSVTIPATVKEIGSSTFQNCSELTTLAFASGSILTKIGQNAFYNCTKLTGSITFPSMLISIEESAFDSCSNIITVDFNTAYSLRIIDNSAFSECYGITGTVRIPNTVEYVGSYAFARSAIETLYLSTSMTVIKEHCFENTYITSITIPASIQVIENGAFSECTSLEEVNLVEFGMLKRIEGTAFGRTRIKLVKVPAAVEYLSGFQDTYVSSLIFSEYSKLKEIAPYAFDGSSLTGLTLPEGLKIIGDCAFRGCAISNLVLPSTLEIIGAYAFREHCLEFINLPNSVTSIGEYCFADAQYPVSGITLSSGLKTIPNYAFYSCGQFHEMEIPEGVHSIGSYAFYNCSITILDLPSSLGRINSSAFDSYLTDVIYHGTSYEWSAKVYSSDTYVNSVVSSNGFYESAEFNYNILGSNIHITELKNIPCNNKIYIPKTIKNSSTGTTYNVVGIEENAFKGNSYIKKVYIPETVTFINANAFYGCSALMTVKGMKGVSYIGDYAFYNCTKLENIELPSTLSTIGESAFRRCYALTSITIPKNVNTINDYAFYDCTKLKTVNFEVGKLAKIPIYAFYGCRALENINIPNSITEIASYAFGYCTSVHEINLPDSVSIIEHHAFIHCEKLRTIKIPKNVTKITSNLFNNCVLLKTIYLPDGITTIESSAFYYCTSLNSINLPESLHTIGASAFSKCWLLDSVNIPDNVVSIGSNGFYECKKLQTIKLSTNPLFTTIDGAVFAYCTSLKSIYIPDNVTVIGTSAFSNCTSLIEINLHENIKNIQTSSFYGTAITNLTVHGGIDTLSMYSTYMFENCKSLKTVVLEEGINKITSYMFMSCTALESITIPKSVKSIGDSAFNNCSKLTNVYYNGSETSWNNISISTTNNTTLINATKHYINDIEITDISTTAGSNECIVTNIKLPSGNYSLPGTIQWTDGKRYTIVSFKSNIFTALNITKLILPDTIKTIPEEAFRGSSLAEIVLSDNVTSIGGGAFIDTLLTTFKWPRGTTVIPEYVFGQSHMETLYLPETITEIEDYAFDRMPDLKDIYYEGTLAQWNALIEQYEGNYSSYDGLDLATVHCSDAEGHPFEYEVIDSENIRITKYTGTATSVIVPAKIDGYNVADVGYRAFTKVDDIGDLVTQTLTSIQFLGPTNIGNGAFEMCEALTTIKLCEGMTYIGDYAFAACSKLASIIIPSTVQTIGESAFAECYALTTVIMPLNLKELKKGAFINCKKLTNPALPSSLTIINEEVFLGCEAITSVVIPTKVTCIANKAFYRCSNLSKIELSEGLEIIGDYAFYQTTNIIDVVFPDSVKTIGKFAFKDSGIEYAIFGKNLESIGDSAFMNTCLYWVELPNSVKTIGESAFRACDAAYIKFPDNPEFVEISDYAFYDLDDMSELIIPDSVTRIGKHAFDECDYITKIKLSENLQIIDDYAFYYYVNYPIVIPDTVTYIGQCAVDEASEIVFENVATRGFIEIAFDAFGSTYALELSLPQGKIWAYSRRPGYVILHCPSGYQWSLYNENDEVIIEGFDISSAYEIGRIIYEYIEQNCYIICEPIS